MENTATGSVEDQMIHAALVCGPAAVLQQIRGLYGRYRGKIADVKTSPNDLTVFLKEILFTSRLHSNNTPKDLCWRP